MEILQAIRERQKRLVELNAEATSIRMELAEIQKAVLDPAFGAALAPSGTVSPNSP